MSEEVLEKGREIKRQARIDPKEFIMKIVFIVVAVIFVAAVVTICVFIFAQAFPALKEIGLFKFLFGTHWWPTIDEPQFGIAPMIVGSIYVTAGSLIIGVPIGLLVAVFMAFYCPKPLYKVMKPITNILAGIPFCVLHEAAGYHGHAAAAERGRTDHLVACPVQGPDHVKASLGFVEINVAAREEGHLFACYLFHAVETFRTGIYEIIYDYYVIAVV